MNLDALYNKFAAGAHSIFSPSGSKMWLTCSGSLVPNLLAPDSGSPEAAEGTVAHTLSEIILTRGLPFARRQVGKTVTESGWDIEITDDMLAHCRDYADWCVSVGGHQLVEQRVDFSHLTPVPNQAGTADHIALHGDTLVVTDLKFGRGVPVYVEDSSQARIYALAALREWDEFYGFRKIVLRIAQPRLDYWGEQTIDRDELMQFGGYVKDRAKRAWQVDAPRTPTNDGCTWCKIATTCAARAAMISALADEKFSDMTVEYDADALTEVEEDLQDGLGLFFVPPPVPELSTSSLEKLLTYRKVVEKFFNQIYDELLQRACTDGEKLELYKVVRGRANRVFMANQKAVIAALVKAGLPPSQCHQTDFVSPAEAERRLRAKAGLKLADAKKVVNSLTVSPPGNQSLAPVQDRRDDIGSFGDRFSDMSDEN